VTPYETIRTVTRRGVVLTLAVFCGVMGFYYGCGLLIAMCEALVATVVLAYVYVRMAAAGLSVARTFTPRAYEEEQVRVALRVRNRSWLPLYLVELRDWFAADGLPLKHLVVQRVPARSSGLQIEYIGACVHGRGRFDVGPLEATVSDPLGLFTRRRVFAERGELVVYPRTFPVRDLGLQELMWRAPVSAPSNFRAGQAATFLGTREYRAGDNVRHIHWPSTARWGKLILKEFEVDTNLEVTIFLDLCQKSLRGVGRGSNIEYGVRIAASIADHVTQRLFACQLIADPGPPIVIPPRTGKHHLIAILDTLARVRSTGKQPYLDLVTAGMRFVGDGAAVVLLFTTLDIPDDGFYAVSAELMRKGARVVPVVMDESTFLPVETAGLQRAEGEKRLAKVRQLFGLFGVEPLVIRSGEDLARAFGKPIAPRAVKVPESAPPPPDVEILEVRA
jgi:uncharacterized protein (DUF58 family)